MARKRCGFDRFEFQCIGCSCYIDNWDDEVKETYNGDHNCTLEHDLNESTECMDYDPVY